MTPLRSRPPTRSLTTQLTARTVILGAKKSETVYSGNEGEEKAQTTYNYNFDGDAIKTVTDLTYTN